MQSFAPEFSPFWLHGQDVRAEPADDGPDAAAMRAEEKALEELADRVSAARTVA